MRSSLALVLATCVAVLSLASLASAQRVVVPGPEGGTTGDIGRARDQFANGTTAAEEGRWVDALGAFRESYRLSGIAAALYNAATTYRSLGRYLDSRDTFDQLLREHPDLGEEMADDARRLRAEVGARVASLEVEGLPEPGDDLRLRLDGSAVTDAGDRPLILEIDPGQRAFGVDRDRHEPFLWEGNVADGARERIMVELIALPESGPRTGRIVLFLALGAVLIAGGITAALLLREEGLQPESTNVLELR